jgi:hypothetical protein
MQTIDTNGIEKSGFFILVVTLSLLLTPQARAQDGPDRSQTESVSAATTFSHSNQSSNIDPPLCQRRSIRQ